MKSQSEIDCLPNTVYLLIVSTNQVDLPTAMRLPGHRPNHVTWIPFALFGHGCKPLVDLLYIKPVDSLLTVRLHDQKITLNHTQEIVDELGTIWV